MTRRKKASAEPPNGLDVKSVPQFVTIGFDDNGYSGLTEPSNPWGMTWAANAFASRMNPKGKGNPQTFDGTHCKATFYLTTEYIGEQQQVDPPGLVKRAWHNALKMGHEMGNHTHLHPQGRKLSSGEWEAEIDECTNRLLRPPPGELFSEMDNEPSVGIGLNRDDLVGFRSPYLSYNDSVLGVLEKKGYLYDASIEEGWQQSQDGTNFCWPYTLDNGSPGHDYSMAQQDSDLEPLTPHPGLWEVPVHVVIAPPDELCEKYGIPSGFRTELATRQSYFDVKSGKITGLDWNMLVDFKMTKWEFLATLKYSFDLRLAGNRCPFIFCGHSDVYSPGYDFPPNITWIERQEVIETFLDYVLTKPEVRIVSVRDVIKWIENPFCL